MDTGEFLTRWTVRLALALYVMGLALRAGPYSSRRRLAWARLAWTAGCFAFLLHVIFAFQFYYHWSDATAYTVTARRTAEIVGLDWGGGLYANYAFTLVWVLDVCWWWAALDGYQARPRSVEWAVQGFLGFMAFNATVVFGTGGVRWLGLAVCFFLAGAWGYHAGLLRKRSSRRFVAPGGSANRR
jgi:hypothetical protein